MDKIWDRKSFELGDHWPLWRDEKPEWPCRTDKSRTLKHIFFYQIVNFIAGLEPCLNLLCPLNNFVSTKHLCVLELCLCLQHICVLLLTGEIYPGHAAPLCVQSPWDDTLGPWYLWSPQTLRYFVCRWTCQNLGPWSFEALPRQVGNLTWSI